jgi:hypothetical protein
MTMAARETFEVVFPDWYDERGESEAEAKGWLQGVEVRFSNGAVHPLFFYDPVRLAQDLEEETAQGRPFIGYPGLVVVPGITREAIVGVVAKLVESDFFPTHFGPNGPINSTRAAPASAFTAAAAVLQALEDEKGQP